ncbi:hypothetical protein Bca52824_028014 [Brassica carinata]|uniref:Uncharacterized protein n=1 Tax=Brassica carinata TaxID=52824 RepID=A0A8X7VBI2_BRACI|nr:hypothetical protein Bca52824_028014 [Brassica carinata]
MQWKSLHEEEKLERQNLRDGEISDEEEDDEEAREVKEVEFEDVIDELRDLSGDEVKKMTEVDDKPLEHAMSCLKLDEALKDPTDASASAKPAS